MNCIRYIALLPIMCMAHYTYYAGVNTEVTAVIKRNATRDHLDEIQYPNTSNYYDERSLAMGVNKQFDFSSYHVAVTGTVYPFSKTHTLFDSFDPKAHDDDGDAYSTHVGRATQKAHVAVYLGAGLENWDVGLQCELKRYDFTYSHYETEEITEPWNNKLFIGPMFRARVPVAENLSFGLHVNRLWGPDTLASDLPNHAVSNTEDYTDDNVNNQDTTFSTTWYKQLEKTDFTTTSVCLFIEYALNGEGHE